MKKEFNFKKAKPVGNRFKGADVKVSVTTRIAPEIVAWLRIESEKKGIPYQTLINSLLKQAMNSHSDEARIRQIVKEEIKKKASGD
jgi:predicted DNA binding CopG/RHH family protein